MENKRFRKFKRNRWRYRQTYFRLVRQLPSLCGLLVELLESDFSVGRPSQTNTLAGAETLFLPSQSRSTLLRRFQPTVGPTGPRHHAVPPTLWLPGPSVAVMVDWRPNAQWPRPIRPAFRLKNRSSPGRSSLDGCPPDWRPRASRPPCTEAPSTHIYPDSTCRPEANRCRYRPRPNREPRPQPTSDTEAPEYLPEAGTHCR